jgi:hypothetical protein
MQELKKFLSNPKNSRSREILLMHRLIYDVELASSTRGNFLDVFQGEVDQNGFDIIFDDHDELKKLQVKTVLLHSKTSSWSIHKCMLRPNPFLAEGLGFEPSPEGAGYQGGVILMAFECDDLSISVDYYYTDIFIIKAFNIGIISYNQSIKNNAVKSLYDRLQRGISHEKVKVSKSAFLKAKSAGHLLALAGLHSHVGSSWPNPLVNFLGHQKNILKGYVAHELRKLVSDNDISFCSPPLKEA